MAQNPRRLFIPKLPQLKERCPSCPFREGNNAEFGEVVERLRRKAGNAPVTKGQLFGITESARASVLARGEGTGEFHCHQTAYQGPNMELTPVRERRQCPGATAFFIANWNPLASNVGPNEDR